ncbi:MAG TPA: TIGR03118 family protein [Pseudonocardiaceae bacterium]|nr:TIGR03118 family protein [Pseudonocardiaceae bacterium]
MRLPVRAAKLVRRSVACLAIVSVAACTTGTTASPAPPSSSSADNRYRQVNLAANTEAYRARFTLPEMVNAWGIAIRPKGAGGHFWVVAGEASYQFVGDVSASDDQKLRELSQDRLKAVTIPGADTKTDDTSVGKATGVIFNGADINSDKFVVTDQPAQVDGHTVMLGGSARFIFATDSGRIAAWGERGPDGNVVRVDGPSQEVFNGEPQGMQFFGLAIKEGDFDTLWAADFGAQPQIRQFDKSWTLVPTQGFANPFATGALVDPADPAKGKQAKPGDPVPFNITTVGDRVFVAYAISKAPDEPAVGGPAFDAGEEDSLNKEQEKATEGRPDKGKLAEFSSNGALVRVFEDDGRLNAPWGVTVAPPSFGPLGGRVLVSNFGGAGRITAFDDTTGKFIDYMRDEAGAPIGIDGIWNILFGNGQSLGDADALYFAAGPADETEALFGSLRAAR